MANKLLEELFEMKSKFWWFAKWKNCRYNQFYEQKWNNSALHKYLIDNFEKVKAKTLADFWIELANKITNKMFVKV